jgi:hypothetical protein
MCYVCMCWCRNRCCSIVSYTCMKPPKQGWKWTIAISFIEGTKYVSFVFNYMDVTSLEHWSLTYTRFLRCCLAVFQIVSDFLGARTRTMFHHVSDSLKVGFYSCFRISPVILRSPEYGYTWKWQNNQVVFFSSIYI